MQFTRLPTNHVLIAFFHSSAPFFIVLAIHMLKAIALPTTYNQVSIGVTPISVIVSYKLRKLYYQTTKTQLVRLVSVMR